MSILRRASIVVAAAAALAVAAPVAALAADTAPTPPAAPPTANCGFLSAVVCQVPVNILVPVNIGSVFPPSQPSPGS